MFLPQYQNRTKIGPIQFEADTPFHHPRIDLRYIQELLGHKSSKTTEIYTDMSNKDIMRVKSPLDSTVKDLHLEDGVEGYED